MIKYFADFRLSEVVNRLISLPEKSLAIMYHVCSLEIELYYLDITVFLFVVFSSAQSQPVLEMNFKFPQRVPARLNS